jgi:antitoxin component YwqK of YwqJK toxin-antitoxin module
MKTFFLSVLISTISLGNFAQAYNSSDYLTYTDSTFTVLYTGVFKIYENGKLTIKTNILNGQLNGVGYYYYPSGKLLANFHFKNNMQEGDQTRYYESGKVKSKEYYVRGLMHGYNVHYYENGKIREEANLVHGVFEGKYSYYDTYGNRIQGGIYKENKTVGTWVFQTGSNSVRTITF